MNIEIEPPVENPQTDAPGPGAANTPRASIHKRRLREIYNTGRSTRKFYGNKLTAPFVAAVLPSAAVRADALAHYAGPDENGLIQGGNPHWQYFSAPFTDSGAMDAEKYRGLRAALSSLPAGPAFKFHSDPMLGDQAVIRRAFADAGFKAVNRPTFLYKPQTESFDELVKNFSSDTRAKVRKAQRDLEITTMSVDDFFDFYEENLQNKGEEHRWFPLNLDRKVLKEAILRPDPDIEIVAARRKSTPDNPGPHPIDAAILCSRGSDGYFRFLRVTYRTQKDNDNLPAPHQQAIKLIVTEIMLHAAKKGAMVDTDGFTDGGKTLYTRFGQGVFELYNQDIFTRPSLHNTARQVMNKVAPSLGRFI